MKNKFLIVIIVLIVILVGGLSYYRYFMWNKEKVVTKTELSSTEMSTILDTFPYEMLVSNKSIEVKDLTKEQILYIGYKGLTENQIVVGDVGTCDSTDNAVLVKCIAKNLGLTDEQINKINTQLWEDSLGGSTKYEMFSPELINSVINNKLGLTNQLSESFKKNIGFSCVTIGFIYDKELNMFFAHEGGGCALETKHEININQGYKEDDTYKINFTEGIFDIVEETEQFTTYNLHSEANPTVLLKEGIKYVPGTSQLHSLVSEYKDKLDNYTITFKKVGNNYQFVSLDYIK